MNEPYRIIPFTTEGNITVAFHTDGRLILPNREEMLEYLRRIEGQSSDGYTVHDYLNTVAISLLIASSRIEDTIFDPGYDPCSEVSQYVNHDLQTALHTLGDDMLEHGDLWRCHNIANDVLRAEQRAKVKRLVAERDRLNERIAELGGE